MDLHSVRQEERTPAAAGQTMILDPSTTTRPDRPITIAVPGVHLAGSDAHYDAHIEVGRHGFALFLTPTAEYPALDIDGTREQLETMLQGLRAALTSRKEGACPP